MKISKETSDKTLKYFGDILGCKTKSEIRDIRNKVNKREREWLRAKHKRENALHKLVKNLDSTKRNMYNPENKTFEEVEDEYLF